MGLLQTCRIRSNETSIDRSRRAEPCVKIADGDVKRFPRYGFLKSPGQLTMGKIHLGNISDPRWQLSGLNSRSKKFVLIGDAKRPPTNQISSSKHVLFLRNKIPKICLSFVWDILLNLLPYK